MYRSQQLACESLDIYSINNLNRNPTCSLNLGLEIKSRPNLSGWITTSVPLLQPEPVNNSAARNLDWKKTSCFFLLKFEDTLYILLKFLKYTVDFKQFFPKFEPWGHPDWMSPQSTNFSLLFQTKVKIPVWSLRSTGSEGSGRWANSAPNKAYEVSNGSCGRQTATKTHTDLERHLHTWKMFFFLKNQVY